MRVIFNVDAITAPLTGIGRYALELARGLAAHSAIEELKLYSAYRWVDDPGEALSANRTIAALRRSVPFKTQALELYAQMRGALFRAHTRRLKGWLLHTPNYILMPFDGPALTTVHDLSWIAYPDAHPIERVRFLDRHLPRTLERANLVLTDSEFIAGEIATTFAVPRAKIRVVPLGVGAEYRPRALEELTPTLARHGLAPGNYLLVVATLEPRKNLARLARAYASLPAATRTRYPLVIVGARGWLNADLERTLEPLEAKGEARRLGYVDEADLPLIYAGARAFAFPSLYEGFGLPVLEAMASGVPVLTSKAASMPEVGGDTALLVDPHDESALSNGLARVLDDAQWRARAAASGIERARGYAWTRTVDETVGAYREAIASAVR